jgi:hypothetical protein
MLNALEPGYPQNSSNSKNKYNSDLDNSNQDNCINYVNYVNNQYQPKLTEKNATFFGTNDKNGAICTNNKNSASCANDKNNASCTNDKNSASGAGNVVAMNVVAINGTNSANEAQLNPEKVSQLVIDFENVYHRFQEQLNKLRQLNQQYPCKCSKKCLHKKCNCYTHNGACFIPLIDEIDRSSTSIQKEIKGKTLSPSIIDAVNDKYYGLLGIVKSYSDVDYLPIDDSINLDEQIECYTHLNAIICNIGKISYQT